MPRVLIILNAILQDVLGMNNATLYVLKVLRCAEKLKCNQHKMSFASFRTRHFIEIELKFPFPKFSL